MKSISNPRGELKPGESYTIKVGDLCFFALGQIVDRGLLVLGSVVKDGIVWIRSRSLNSPVEFPALAVAARKDWTGLTRKEHELLLEGDALENGELAVRRGRCYDAVQRLLFYYPDDGQRLVKALLQSTTVTTYDQAELVRTLEAFDWPGLRDDLFALCQRASHGTPAAIDGRLMRDALLLACSNKLKGSSQFESCARILGAEITSLSTDFRQAQADPLYEKPGSPAYAYRVYQYALNTWLEDANHLVAAR